MSNLDSIERRFQSERRSRNRRRPRDLKRDRRSLRGGSGSSLQRVQKITTPIFRWYQDPNTPPWAKAAALLGVGLVLYILYARAQRQRREAWERLPLHMKLASPHVYDDYTTSVRQMVIKKRN